MSTADDVMLFACDQRIFMREQNRERTRRFQFVGHPKQNACWPALRRTVPEARSAAVLNKNAALLRPTAVTLLF